MTIEPQMKERLRSERAEGLIMDADRAALLIEDGMAVGISGFTNAGYRTCGAGKSRKNRKNRSLLRCLSGT